MSYQNQWKSVVLLRGKTNKGFKTLHFTRRDSPKKVIQMNGCMFITSKVFFDEQKWDKVLYNE